MTANTLRVAIAHDYLTQRGGAERVVLAMTRAFPDAPIYTTLFNPEATFPEFGELDVRTSWLNRVGYFRRNHRAALPVLPVVSRAMRVDADVVLASSSGWAHGFSTGGRKIVYCYSPARWLYQSNRYLREGESGLVSAALALLTPALRRWDVRSAQSADSYLAISTDVRQRIRDAYGRDATVVPAPCTMVADVPSKAVGESLPKAGYYLVVSRLLPYKNVDAVVEAFRMRPERRLVVVGTGPEKSRIRAMAAPNIEFLEDLTDQEMAWIYSYAAGLVAASYEDFGLTPLEAAARGKPSAVLRWGGFLDTVVEGVTGTFFDQPTPRSIAEAVDRLARRSWDPETIQADIERFSEGVFAASLQREVERVCSSPQPIVRTRSEKARQ